MVSMLVVVLVVSLSVLSASLPRLLLRPENSLCGVYTQNIYVQHYESVCSPVHEVSVGLLTFSCPIQSFVHLHSIYTYMYMYISS